MAVTFVVKYIDPLSDHIAVLFSDRPTAVLVPIDRNTAPSTWQQAISDWYASHPARTARTDAVVGQTFNVLPPTT